jgi:hypothetical protein
MVMQLCWQAPEIKGDLSVFKIVTLSISGSQKLHSEARAAQLLAVRWMLLLGIFTMLILRDYPV